MTEITERELNLIIKNQDKVYELTQKTFDKIDNLSKEFTSYKEETSSRLTKIEVKSGIIGFLSALLSSIGIHIWK